MMKLSIREKILAAITLSSISFSGFFRDTTEPAYAKDAPQETRIKSTVAPLPPTLPQETGIESPAAPLPPTLPQETGIESTVAPKPPPSAPLPPPSIEDEKTEIEDRDTAVRSVRGRRPRPFGGFFRQLVRCR